MTDAAEDGPAMKPLLPAVCKLASSVSFRLRGQPGPVPLFSALSAISRHKVVIFGERHHQPDVLKAQLALLAGLAGPLGAGEPGKVTLVLEMVNLEQQALLDRFIADPGYRPEQLQEDYDRTGREAFDLAGHYGFLLQLARELGCGLKAGFLPKQYARLAMSDPSELARVAKEKLPGFDLDRYFFGKPGTDAHYAHFEGMIKGMSRRPKPGTAEWSAVTGEMRRIFPAQIAKDASMAYAVDSALRSWPDGRVLAICGNGHSDYGHGPEGSRGRGWGGRLGRGGGGRSARL
ncbi:hypothetical protein DFJ74DRAFT_708127 [Hyaloraphidium curvatum]|nr:hypothetical protein DFJ74DRAFT_708127 [Hyaloraphidium curvatum]